MRAMAFPWDFEENFEAGNKGSFSSATVDSGGRIDFPGPPFSARFNMANSLADAYLVDTAGHAVAAGATKYGRFYLTLSHDFELPEGAYFDLFTLVASGTHEGSIALHRCDPEASS
jgi:hypothetical protein